MSSLTNDWSGQTISQGRYVVRAKLGEGGMGFVFRAQDQNLEADVVIKVPRRSMLDDPEFAARFRARDPLAGRSSPTRTSSRLTDVGEHDGVPFAVMQYLSGGSLDDRRANVATSGVPACLVSRLAARSRRRARLCSRPRLPPSRRQARQHPFRRPRSCLSERFRRRQGDGHQGGGFPFPDRGSPGWGTSLGTPEYLAPEMIMGKPFDGRADQYALAATVYETLAGRRPFEGTTPTATLVMQTTREASPLSRVEPLVPWAASDAVARGAGEEPLRDGLPPAWNSPRRLWPALSRKRPDLLLQHRADNSAPTRPDFPAPCVRNRSSCPRR